MACAAGARAVGITRTMPMRDRNLLLGIPRRDPIHHLVIGHAESPWMEIARQAADAVAIAVALVLLASIPL